MLVTYWGFLAACLAALVTSKSVPSSDPDVDEDYDDYWEKWEHDHDEDWWDDHEMAMAEAEMGMGMAEAEMEMEMAMAEAEAEAEMEMAMAESEVDTPEEDIDDVDNEMMDDDEQESPDSDVDDKLYDDNNFDKKEDTGDDEDYEDVSERVVEGTEGYELSPKGTDADDNHDVTSIPEEKESERVFQPVAMPTDFASYDVAPEDGHVSLTELVQVTGARENVEAVFNVSDINHDGFIDENEFYAAPLKLDGKLPKEDAPDGLALLKDDVASLGADTDRQNDETVDLPTEGTGDEKEENGNDNSTASD